MHKKYFALLLVLGAVMLSGVSCGKDCIEEQTGGQIEQTETNENTENAGFPELNILSVTEDNEWVAAETTYGVLKYPAAFSDILKVNAVNEKDAAQLQVLVQIGEEDIVVYTLHYNKETGIPCGKLKLSDDIDEMNVYVAFEDAPESLSSDGLATFYAVQETFNDVIVSMAEGGHFTTAE